MLLRMTGENIDSGGDSHPVLTGQEALAVQPGSSQHIERHIDLTSSAMQRHQQKQPGHCLRHSGMTGLLGNGGCKIRCQYKPRKLNKHGGGFASIPFECIAIFGSIIVKVENPGLEHIEKWLYGQTVRRNSPGQGCGKRVRHAVAPRIPLQHITPPLQADFTRQGIPHQITDAGDLGVESIERSQIRPLFCRRKETGKIPVPVALAKGSQTEILTAVT